MKKILIIIFSTPLICFGQNYIGLKTDLMNYNLKSQYGRIGNNGVSYSGFAEFKFKPLVSFGIEAGGYKFKLDKNKSTNLFIKPTIIFNVQTGRSNFAVHGGVSFDASIKRDISTPYNSYITRTEPDTAIIEEKAFFYKSFASLLVGVSYNYRITERFNIGIRIETSGTQGGFYKGYESTFNRYGLFVKYKI